MKKFRSQEWFGAQDKHGFLYRSWLKNRGFPQDMFDGKPVIGICNTWSELTPCNSHFRVLADHVRWGILEAGGFPLEFPVTSTGESIMRPTAMLFRNLVSMDVEESIRANPLDGVVLLMGCDKTTPALIMGASSVDLPTIGVSGGPMLRGVYRGQHLGSGTNVFTMSEQVRAGELSVEEFHEAEACMHRSHGHCMTMGTASTMASMVEAMGLSLPGNAAIPAVDARRALLARESGRRIVELVKNGVKISHVLTRQAFENAIVVNSAIGGSTNAVVHLLAIAGRLGVDLTQDDFDKLGASVDCLVNLMPAGKYLMEDFFEAGGLPVVISELGKTGHFRKDAFCVNGTTVWQNSKDAVCFRPDVIRPASEPFIREAGLAVLKGNLAPDGAIIKPAAASPHLLKHTGRAVVFDSVEEFNRRIADPDLDIDANSVMVLRNCGPRGYPGMPEVGNMALPTKLLKSGITDLVRVTDARMSGTAYGTVVLHVSPEAAVGGPLSLVQEGDLISLDVEARCINLMVSDAELATRQGVIPSQPVGVDRGYRKLYRDTVMQADKGADLSFLVGKSGAFVDRHGH